MTSPPALVDPAAHPTRIVKHISYSWRFVLCDRNILACRAGGVSSAWFRCPRPTHPKAPRRRCQHAAVLIRRHARPCEPRLGPAGVWFPGLPGSARRGKRTWSCVLSPMRSYPAGLFRVENRWRLGWLLRLARAMARGWILGQARARPLGGGWGGCRLCVARNTVIGRFVQRQQPLLSRMSAFGWSRSRRTRRGLSKRLFLRVLKSCVALNHKQCDGTDSRQGKLSISLMCWSGQ